MLESVRFGGRRWSIGCWEVLRIEMESDGTLMAYRYVDGEVHSGVAGECTYGSVWRLS